MVNIIKRFSRNPRAAKTGSAETSKSDLQAFRNQSTAGINLAMPSSPYNGGKKKSRALIDDEDEMYEMDSESEELEGSLGAHKLKINLTVKQ